MKKTKLFLLPILLALTLGSCGSNGEFKSEKSIKSKLITYNNKVDFNDFIAYESKFDDIYSKRLTRDYIVSYDKYYTTEFDDLTYSGGYQSQISQMHLDGKVDADKQKYNYKINYKFTYDDKSKDQNSNFGREESLEPSSNGFTLTTTNFSNNEKPSTHTSNWGDYKLALAHFSDNTEFGINKMKELMSLSSNSTYYVDNMIYTKVDNDSIYQLKITDFSISFLIIDTSDDFVNHQKINGANYFYLKLTDVKM